MIATHASKIFDAQLKQSAVSARIVADIPHNLICSKTVNLKREFFAAPINAAKIKEWKEKTKNIVEGGALKPDLPEINDPRIKQILLPFDWRNDDYVSITPVPSLGLINELYNRLYELNYPFWKWVIQPNYSAYSNHGETLLMQEGIVRMLRRGVAKVEQGKWTGDFVQITARCENMNISSGMVAVGFPAITAIGGFVHSLERVVEHDISFAIGLKNAYWKSGVSKIIVNKSGSGASTGRVKGKNIKPSPSYKTDELTANCEIVLLLKSDVDPNLLVEKLKSKHRLAGGSLFDMKISIVKEGQPEVASYLIDASKDMFNKTKLWGKLDALKTALEMYALDGEWRDGQWMQLRNGYTLNQTGYAFLETPKKRDGVRGGYSHAWAEPVYNLITQGSMTNKGWWSRDSKKGWVGWRGN